MYRFCCGHGLLFLYLNSDDIVRIRVKNGTLAVDSMARRHGINGSHWFPFMSIALLITQLDSTSTGIDLVFFSNIRFCFK